MEKFAGSIDSKRIKEQNSIPRMVPSVYAENSYYICGNMPTSPGNGTVSLLQKGGDG